MMTASSDAQLGANVAKTVVKDVEEASSPNEIDAGATTAEGGSTPVAFTEPSRPSSPQISKTPVDSAEHVTVEPQGQRLEAALHKNAADSDADSDAGAKDELAAEAPVAEEPAAEEPAAEEPAAEEPAAEEPAAEEPAAEEPAAEEPAAEEPAAEEPAAEEPAAEELAEDVPAAKEFVAERAAADCVEEAVAQDDLDTENRTNTQPKSLSEAVVNSVSPRVSDVTDPIKDVPEENEKRSEDPTACGTVRCSPKVELAGCPESKTTMEDTVQEDVCAQSQDAEIVVPSPSAGEQQSLSAGAGQVTEPKAKEHLGSTQECYSVETSAEMGPACSNTVEILPLTLPCAMNPQEYLQEGLRVPYDAPPPTTCPAAAPSPLDYATLRTYVSLSTPPVAPGAAVGPPLWHPTLKTAPTRVIDLPGHPAEPDSETKTLVESVPGSPVVRGFGCCGGRKKGSAQLKPATDAPEAPSDAQQALSLDQRPQESFCYTQAIGAHAPAETSGRFYPHPPPAAIYSRYYYVPSRSGTETGEAPVYRVHGPYSAALVSASGVLSEAQQETETDGAALSARPFDGRRSPTVYPQTAYSAPGQSVPAIWPAATEGYTPMTADNFVPVSPAPSTTGLSQGPKCEEAHDALSDHGATVVTATFPADQASEASQTQASESAAKAGASRKPVQKRLGTAFGQWLTASFGCCGSTRERPATETPCQQAPTPFYMDRQPSGCSAPASHRSFSYCHNRAETASLRRLDSQISAATSAMKLYPAGPAPAERIYLAMPDAAYPAMQQL